MKNAAKKAATEFGFTINQVVLLAELNRLSGVTEKSTTIPILGSVLFEVDSDGLHLSATNLDLSLRTTAPIGLISTPGSACLPARKLHEIAKNLPKGVEVEFSHVATVETFAVSARDAIDLVPRIAEAGARRRVERVGVLVRATTDAAIEAMTFADTALTFLLAYLGQKRAGKATVIK